VTPLNPWPCVFPKGGAGPQRWTSCPPANCRCCAAWPWEIPTGKSSAYNISIKTVDTYRFRLLKKLNLRNNAELSRFAIQNGLIEA
jgi:hypothetical protein